MCAVHWDPTVGGSRSRFYSGALVCTHDTLQCILDSAVYNMQCSVGYTLKHTARHTAL